MASDMEVSSDHCLHFLVGGSLQESSIYNRGKSLATMGGCHRDLMRPSWLTVGKEDVCWAADHEPHSRPYL